MRSKPVFSLGRWQQVAYIEYTDRRKCNGCRHAVVVDRMREGNILRITLFSRPENGEYYGVDGVVFLLYPSLTVIASCDYDRPNAVILLEEYIKPVWDRILKQIEKHSSE